MFSPSQYDLSACQHISISAEGRSRNRSQEAGLCRIESNPDSIYKYIQDVTSNLANQRPQILTEMGDFSVAPSC